MGFFDWLLGRKSEVIEELQYTQKDIDAVSESAQRCADVLNESLKICKESRDIDTKLSRLYVAKEKLEQVKSISKNYPFIKLEYLEQVEDEIIGLENDIANFNLSALNDNVKSNHGEYEGNHYTSYVEKVKDLKRNRKHAEAIELLSNLVKATENESVKTGFGVAPWYYEQLAIIYRKEKEIEKEIAILERYQKQIKAPGSKPKILEERLSKAKNLLIKAKA